MIGRRKLASALFKNNKIQKDADNYSFIRG
jgi:hypothetical protein